VTWSLLSRSAGRPYRLSLRPDALVRRHSLFGATLSGELGSLWPRPPTHCWIDPTECVDRHRLKADAAYYTPSRPWVLSDLDSRGLDSSAKPQLYSNRPPRSSPHVLRACMPTGNAVVFLWCRCRREFASCLDAKLKHSTREKLELEGAPIRPSTPITESNADVRLALPCLALPCLALPCLALPCLALPCLALPCRGSLQIASHAAVLSALLRTYSGSPCLRPWLAHTGFPT
jgi:hypothetical protein